MAIDPRTFDPMANDPMSCAKSLKKISAISHLLKLPVSHASIQGNTFKKNEGGKQKQVLIRLKLHLGLIHI